MVPFLTPGRAAGFFFAARTPCAATATLATLFLTTLVLTSPALIRSALAQAEVTVFAPYRGIEAPIARAGSAVSVITREAIEASGALSTADLVSQVPGVNLTSAGGPGSQSDVRIRGTEAQHTMVLIDGVPVSNTTSTRNTFEWRTLSPSGIERIEVLRGPQSALYGSDAIGGVINIITRRASRGLSASASVEGGSFGTHREVLQASYGGARGGLFASLSHLQTDGFSRRSDDDEDDGFQQWSGLVSGTVEVSETLSLDAQLQVSDTETEYDSSSNDDDARERTFQTLSGHVRARHESFEGRWINTLTVSASTVDSTDDRGRLRDRVYEGRRLGLDATSSFAFERYGTLLAGFNVEEQSADQGDVGRALSYEADEVFWGAFAMHQFSLGPNVHLSAAIRFDDFDQAGSFVTGRGTAVYEVFETETRLHASLGTGAKAPTLYQRFNPSVANADLLPEESLGFDAGITQTLFDGLLTVDVTGFYNQIDNLIDYDFDARRFENISEAETFGFEVTADARLIPGQFDASAHYTYLIAENGDGERLRRRPEHEAQLTLSYVGVDRLTLSSTATFVGGDHFSSTGERDPLDPYVVVDVQAAYQVHEHLELFGRVENLFDTEYEERKDFNTAGLSAYVGLRASF